ncbi:MAG: 4-(cytidine 5'-diphospho)-2-C-methyl-D-erythritol kinase [Actinobacteria bacterium]|nr:4-(cytidine 5'-diphospho)-2-C-methyl-D-erythritol kinase [Actinomycetota bacterium]
MRISSYAKINLGLRILGKRPDGYHEIETIFQQISLKDELDIEPADRGISLACSPPVCPTDETNLVFKAACELQKKSGRKTGAEIKILKKIPVGGGLGGGSSNAAAALQGLNTLWNTGQSIEELIELGARIGSDVPFFLLGGTAVGSGRGEKLKPVEIFQNYWGVLLVPGFSISTKWAYETNSFSLTKSLKKSNFNSFLEISFDTEKWPGFLVNDLEKIVFNAYPELKKGIEKFYKSGAFYSQMSGSGSSLFGLFKTKAQARKAKSLFSEYQSFLFQPVSKR